MRVMPIRYVHDIAASEHFYTAIGLEPDQHSRSGHWVELTSAGGLIALHTASAAAPPRSTTDFELCLVTDAPLEHLTARLEAHGITHEGICDENFGRFLAVTDPDGVRIQVNEHDPSLYT